VGVSAGLAARLEAAGVAPDAPPLTAWQALNTAERGRTTIVDLYEMVAASRGVAARDLPRTERVALAHQVFPLVWPGFEVAPRSERPPSLIEVVDYDPEWPSRFEAWQVRFGGVLGPVARTIEHIGSTAVPQLHAKPIIDIMITVDDIEHEVAYVPAIEAEGVQLRSRDDFHRYFRPFSGRPREVHLHVAEHESAFAQDHLLFRDYLRASPDARERYATVKREAARDWADDSTAYTDTKRAVIDQIKVEARLWKHETLG
jgi:GrpB-like predicted nucleotidyltransferase (UPF0157 family)